MFRKSVLTAARCVSQGVLKPAKQTQLVAHQLRHCATAMPSGSLLTVKVDHEHQKLEIKGVIDAIPKTKVQHIMVPLIWLRDHCKCSKCYNHETFQRMQNPLNLLDSVGNFPYDIKDACITQDKLTIIWSDDHISQYGTSYLCAAHTKDLPFPTQTTHTKELWDGDIIAKVSATGALDVQYDNIINEETRDNAIKQLYSMMLRYGICTVKGVPFDDDGQATFDVCDLIGVKQTTLFGTQWKFTADRSSEDTAYTNIELGAHNDGTYYGRSPGVQVFHVLQQAEQGGQTLLVDGFNVAQMLNLQDAESYHTLTKLVVPHQYKGDFIKPGKVDHLLNDHMPVIRLKNYKGVEEVMQIRYNPYDRSTLVMSEGNYAINDFEQFYRAYHKLSELVQNADNEHWIRLEPGTVLFIDNWRVMHGRNAFKGKRVIAGCYLTRDDFISKARILKVW